MKGRLAAVALMLVVSGCAAGYAEQIEMDRPPPSLEREIAALRAGDDCAEYWSRMRPGTLPIEKGEILERCPAVFPVVLQRAGIQGACRTMVDFTADGRAENIESRCRAEAAYEYGPYEKEWIAFAEALLAASADRSFESFRIAPDALGPDDPRTNLNAVTHFMFQGEDGDPALIPPRFERAAQ